MPNKFGTPPHADSSSAHAAFLRAQQEEQANREKDFIQFGEGLKVLGNAIKDLKDKQAVKDFAVEMDPILQAKNLTEAQKVEQLNSSLSRFTAKGVSPEVQEKIGKMVLDQRLLLTTQQSLKESAESQKLTQRRSKIDELSELALVPDERVATDAKLGELRTQARDTLKNIFAENIARQRVNAKDLDKSIEKGEINKERITETNQLFETLKLKKVVNSGDINKILTSLDKSIAVVDPHAKAGLKLKRLADEMSTTVDDLISRVVGDDPKIKTFDQAFSKVQNYLTNKADEVLNLKSKAQKTVGDIFGSVGIPQVENVVDVLTDLPNPSKLFQSKLKVLEKALDILPGEAGADQRRKIIDKLKVQRGVNTASLSELVLRMRSDPNRPGDPSANPVFETSSGKKISLQELSNTIKNLPDPTPPQPQANQNTISSPRVNNSQSPVQNIRSELSTGLTQAEKDKILEEIRQERSGLRGFIPKR